MKVEIFTLCDAATDQHGKLNILGSFDTIWSKTVPCTHPTCAVAIRLRFPSIEEGNHKFRLTFTDADGQPLMQPLEGDIPVKMSPDQISSVRNLVVSFRGIELKEFGEHSIDFAIDGRHEASIPLFMCQIPENK